MAKRTHEEMSYPEMAFFMNESVSDVVFVVNGHRVPAIKQLLIVKSPVFNAMFSENFCESKGSEESKLHEIEIKDTTVDAFKSLIRFIYTERLKFKDSNDLHHFLEVYHLSDRYEVLRLVQKVGKHLVSKINVKDLIPISRVVFALNNEKLMSKVMTFIESNINEVIKWDLKELKELNDATNDKLLDVLLTSDRLESNKSLKRFVVEKKTVFVKKEVFSKNANSFESIAKYTSFNVFKTFIGYLYFDKLILKDKEDFQLIDDVCDIFYLQFEDMEKSFFDCIGNHLKHRITVENLESISKIAFVYKIDGLIKRFNEFIEENITEIIAKSDQQLCRMNSRSDSLFRCLLKSHRKFIQQNPMNS